MPTSIIRLPYKAPAATKYTVPSYVAGVPGNFLRSHFRFSETAFTAGLLDDVTGIRYPMVGNALSASDTQALGAQGGLTIAGVRSLAGPLVDVVSPFSVILAALIATPATNGARELWSIGEFPTRGVLGFQQHSGAVAADLLHSTLFWPSSNGATGSNFFQTPQPWVAQYTRMEIIVFTTDGAGNCTLQQRRGLNKTVTSFTASNTGWLGPSSGQQGFQTLRVGNFGNNFPNARAATYDLFSFYNKVLTEDEIVAWTDAALAQAAARSRLT